MINLMICIWYHKHYYFCAYIQLKLKLFNSSKYMLSIYFGMERVLFILLEKRLAIAALQWLQVAQPSTLKTTPAGFRLAFFFCQRQHLLAHCVGEGLNGKKTACWSGETIAKTCTKDHKKELDYGTPTLQLPSIRSQLTRCLVRICLPHVQVLNFIHLHSITHS